LTDVQSGQLTLNRSGGTIKNTSAVQVSGGTLSVAQDDTVGAVTLSSGIISGVAILTGSSYSLTNTGAVSAKLGGSGVALTKSGTGTATLSGSNSYTGATIVNGGTLKVAAAGSIAASSGVSVANTATLTGSGTTSAITLASGASLAPGDSGIGTLNGTGDATWDGGATFKFDLSNSGNTSDQLALGGALTKGAAGTYQFNFQNSGYWDGVSATTYTLATFGSSTFSVSDFSYTNLASGLSGSFALNAGNLQLVVVPEPGTLAMLLGGLGVLIGFQRSRRSRYSA
jgi:autotransporter-associated beta strand protein